MSDTAVATPPTEYIIQTSFKHGPNFTSMTNCRGRTRDEFGDALDIAIGFGPEIAAAAEALGAVQVISHGMPGTTVVSQQPTTAQSADSSAQSCPHGVMQFRSANDGSWAGHFCPLGKDDPGRCKPRYIKKG